MAFGPSRASDQVPLADCRAGLSDVARANWDESGLGAFGLAPEEWSCPASSHAQRYATHGLFRYFGKLPPYIARQLLLDQTRPGDLVLDPMVGSGTTAVEALLLDRRCAAFDVNPLAVLLTRVKTRRVDAARARRAVRSLLRRVRRRVAAGGTPRLPVEVDVGHWFLPATARALAALRDELATLDDDAESDLLRLALASVVRRVSRATTEQGRLFLDVASAEPDPLPRFEAAAEQAIHVCARLPEASGSVSVAQAAADSLRTRTRCALIVCHPPYFNGYKYSAVLALEMAWLDVPRAAVRRQEVREYFKVAQLDDVERYLDDLAGTLMHLAGLLSRRGTLALLLGDTRLRGVRVPIVWRLLKRVESRLRPERLIVRMPRFTEASWAASQRRRGGQLGVTMTDFLTLLRRT